MSKSSRHSAQIDGRRRLIDAARHLFLQRGAANVGINEITDAANVARMTLYNNFESKEALTAAVYSEMAGTIISGLDRLLVDVADRRSAIEKIFDYFATGTDRSGYRGCAFIQASVQDAQANGAIYEIAQSYKRELRARLRSCLADCEDADELADQILILLDGAVIETYLKGAAAPLESARRAALRLAGD